MRSLFQRHLYLYVGWASFLAGFIGIFLPLLPTTVFWIVAAWLWSKGNPKLAQKIFDHPKFGKPTKAFLTHGIISTTGKVFAGTGISLSFIILLVTTQLATWLYILVGSILCLVILWIITRPTKAPS